MKKNALIIGMLTLLVIVTMAAPVFAAKIQTDPTDSPTPTPDSQTLQGDMTPRIPHPLPEYPLLGGIVAILACFAALAVFKLRKANQ